MNRKNYKGKDNKKRRSYEKNKKIIYNNSLNFNFRND
mgnify:CR=1 FL=1